MRDPHVEISHVAQTVRREDADGKRIRFVHMVTVERKKRRLRPAPKPQPEPVNA